MDKKNMQRISVLARYVNGNHRVEIYSDGTRIRSTGHWEDIGDGNRRWVDDDQDHFTYAFPESFDLKVTDYCDGGCAYCHENSTVKGRHGDLSALDHIVDTIHPGT
jgi:2-iminoacetate synthase ThiH